MYDYIINAIKIENNLGTDKLLAAYLQSLQENVKALRRAYWSYPVKADYSKKENQVAYLIAYFPHYAVLLPYVLRKHCHQIETHLYERHSLGLFGGGPCPELTGYLRFLQTASLTENTKLNVVSFDIAADTWGYSRDMNIRHIASQYLGNSFIEKLIVKQIDIASIKNVSVEEDTSKIAVFQNCLNESAVGRHSAMSQSIKALFQMLPLKSTLIIIDMANYPKVLTLMKVIENDLKNMQGYKLIQGVKSSITRIVSPFSEPPPIISENLLTRKNGLIPRKYISFAYSIIYKE